MITRIDMRLLPARITAYADAAESDFRNDPGRYRDGLTLDDILSANEIAPTNRMTQALGIFLASRGWTRHRFRADGARPAVWLPPLP